MHPSPGAVRKWCPRRALQKNFKRRQSRLAPLCASTSGRRRRHLGTGPIGIRIARRLIQLIMSGETARAGIEGRIEREPIVSLRAHFRDQTQHVIVENMSNLVDIGIVELPKLR